MLQLKDLRERGIGEKVTSLDGENFVGLEGPLGGRAWLQGTEESCRIDETIIPYWYLMSMIILSALDAKG